MENPAYDVVDVECPELDAGGGPPTRWLRTRAIDYGKLSVLDSLRLLRHGSGCVLDGVETSKRPPEAARSPAIFEVPIGRNWGRSLWELFAASSVIDKDAYPFLFD